MFWRNMIWIALIFAACNNTTEKKVDAKVENIHAGHENANEDAEVYIQNLQSGLIKEDTLKGSPMRIAMGDIGESHLHIAYSSPGTKGRVIWGGLVAYDKVWVTGAHKATCIIFTEPAVFAGKQVPAGAYALFTIPSQNNAWTVILNRNYDQHLADDYDEKEDLLRIPVKPIQLDSTVQRLTYHIENKTPDTGVLTISWDKLALQIPLSEK